MRKLFINSALLWLTAVGITASADDKSPPKHLTEAQELVRHLDLKHTTYEHGAARVVWNGTCESHADCSGFVDALLMHSYSYDADSYKRWFDSHRPSARRYHDAIVEEKGFVSIKRIPDVQPGDLLAVKYLTRDDNTGHLMLAAGSLRRIQVKKPLVAGTDQWEISIIDSSKSGHGPSDTRHKKGRNGKDHEGLGEGVLRVYSTAGGDVAGFTWSALDSSEFKSPKEEHLVFGRLKTGFKP